MVSTNDAHGMVSQVERERCNLKGAYWMGHIDPSDYYPIREFTDHREINEDIAPSTLRSDLSNLRRGAQRAQKALLDFEGVKDTNALLKTNAEEYGVSPSSNDNYRKALRVFYRWLNDNHDYGAFEWWNDIKIPSRNPDPIDPAEILTIEEVQKLRETADHPREKALIEFLADTGMRIAAVLQLKRGDVDGINGKRPTVKANRDGEAQKGMDPLPRPIIQSQRWLRQYFNQYHPDDHPEAPVFYTKRHDQRERENAALHPTTSLNKLKKIAEEAGVNRDRVNNHAFRHVATTRMRRDMEMDWDDIAHRTGWSERSLARMKRVYAHLTNEDRNDRVWQAAEIEADEGEESQPVLDRECSNCGRSIGAGERYCSGCGADQEATPDTDMIPTTDIDRYLADMATGMINGFARETDTQIELNPDELLAKAKEERTARQHARDAGLETKVADDE